MNSLPERLNDLSYSAAPESSAERVASMDSRLSADLANGKVGAHHNTYEHRSRVLRKLRGRIAKPQITISIR